MRFEELLCCLRTEQDVQRLDDIREEIARWIPKVRIMFGYDQLNYAHQYDLWMHSLHTVVGMPRGIEDDMLYLAGMLHDIGKPDCQVRGRREGDTNMHYYGHPGKSMEIVRDDVIPGLLERDVLLSEDSQRRLIYYVEYHDDRVSLKCKHLRRHLDIPVSFAEFQKLMLLQVADALAHVQIPIVKERVEICTAWAGEYGEQAYREIAKEQEGD